MNDFMLEKHVTPVQLAEAWGLSAKAVRELFENEPDVLRIERPETRFKRGYTSYRIPESVARRVYARWTCKDRARR